MELPEIKRGTLKLCEPQRFTGENKFEWVDENDKHIDVSVYNVCKFSNKRSDRAMFMMDQGVKDEEVWEIQLVDIAHDKIIASYSCYRRYMGDELDYDLSERRDIELHTLNLGSIVIPYEVWKNYAVIRKYKGKERDLFSEVEEK